MYETTSVLQKYKTGRLSRSQAIKMFAKIGIDEDEAVDLMEEQEDADTTNSD